MNSARPLLVRGSLAEPNMIATAHPFSESVQSRVGKQYAPSRENIRLPHLENETWAPGNVAD